jgi:hypothetical protein
LFGGGPPPDPTRNRRELGLSGSLLGGYDDNLVPPGGGDPVVSYPSGYTGFGDAGLRYWVGRDVRSLEVKGRGFMNTYRNVGVGPSYGAEQSIRARTTLGRRTDFDVAQDLRYDPYFSLGLFGAIQAPDLPGTPDSNPTSALTETRSWTVNTSSGLTHRWTRRTKMDLGFSFNKQSYVQQRAFDSRAVAGSFALERLLNLTTSVRGAYRPSDTQYTQLDGNTLPLRTQTMEVGISYRRRLSPTRQIVFTGGGGPLHVSTLSPFTRVPGEFWRPSGYGTARLDFSRSWSVAADYRRSVTVLQGINPDPFVTDAALVSAGGLVRRWLETVFTAGYSNGQAGFGLGDTPGGSGGSYDGYTASAQARLRMSQLWSAVVSFNHYQYYLNTAASQLLGVAPQLHRNAVRVGLAWSLPLYGRYLATPVTPTDRRD